MAPRPELPARKKAKGTERKHRDVYEVLPAPSGTVTRPDGLSLAAQAVWDDLAGTAEAMGTLKPADSYVFGQFCTMTAHIQAAWAADEPAPSSYIQQWRMLGELFGVAGEKSRVVLKIKDDQVSTNPFSRNRVSKRRV